MNSRRDLRQSLWCTGYRTSSTIHTPRTRWEELQHDAENITEIGGMGLGQTEEDARFIVGRALCGRHPAPGWLQDIARSPYARENPEHQYEGAAIRRLGVITEDTG
jgi:hypothetical protein